jgi:predicted AAA+ superfamily ATPase
MPHPRSRQSLSRFLKLLSFNRVVTIQGCRQAGKSFLARNLAGEKLKNHRFISLDVLKNQEFAKTNPDTFLESHEAHPLIIDEAQKAPPLFDAIKSKVDLDPKPGQFVLLGSSEFSKELKIRESLAGRLAKLRLFTFNFKEAHQITLSTSDEAFGLDFKNKLNRKQLLHHLKMGGFPNIFNVSDPLQRDSLLQDWLNLVIYRDLQTFPAIKADSDLAMQIIMLLAVIEEPSCASLAKKLRRDSRIVQRHLNLLEILFAVHRLNPHPTGTGKPLYFLADVSLAEKFGADFERKLWTWSFHEILSKYAYRGKLAHSIYYYRNSKGSLVHFVEELVDKKSIRLLKILPFEKMDLREVEILKAYRKKHTNEFREILLYGLSHGSLQLKKGKISIYPFEVMG